MRLFVAASAIALAGVPTAAAAQHQSMPGMTMPPKPAAKKAAPAKKAVKKTASKKAGPNKASAKNAAPKAAEPPMDHNQMDHGVMPMTMPMTSPQAAPDAETSLPMDHSTMDHSSTDHGAMGGMDMAGSAHGGHGGMTGAFGPYPMEREASGTAWQPDNSEHMGLMSSSGDWMLMGHGVLNLVYDHQSGRRGDDKMFASGMLMGMAKRPIGNGAVQFKAMLSPDPLMGKSGYPLLLASGETANGTDRLIDRQHPHDLFMELSASVSQNIGANSSLFLYAGLPGEPAFGPPAFMHREAILDSPEAPISHHWLDSTHISFGVLTGGLVLDRVKLEVSRFNGREPDQHRYNIETGPLDSTALRLSWNPTPELALQGSWGYFVDPEQLEPGIDQKRLSASLLYAREVAPGWKLAGTLAWGRKTIKHHDDDAFAAEASLKHAGWTVFGRGEMTENRELIATVENGPAYRVGKASLGAIRDFRIAKHFRSARAGWSRSISCPTRWRRSTAGHHPLGGMAFIRLKLD